MKQAVTTRQAAERYGLRVNRNGMAICPFHPDRNPSMKTDRRYHCFGCGADGDVIDFTARLFGLTNRAAAEKLADDFGIQYSRRSHNCMSTGKKGGRKHRKEQERIKLEKRFRNAEKKFWKILTDYYHLLGEWKEVYAPKNPANEWDERFTEALQKRTKLAYLLDAFLEGTTEERIDLMNNYVEEVLAYERVLERTHRGRNQEAEVDCCPA